MTELSEKLSETLQSVFPDVPGAELSGLKAGAAPWDSLGHLRLMMALEASFQISIPPEAFGQLQSVEQLEVYVRSQ